MDGRAYWRAEDDGIELLNTTLGDLLDRRAEEVPERDAVAKGLMALGLEKGDHVAVWATNLPEWLLLEFASAKAGLILVTVNPFYRANELEYVLNQGDAKALFFQARVRDYDCLATVHALVTPGETRGVVRSERLPELHYVCLIGLTPPEFVQQAGWRPASFGEMVEGGAAISSGGRAAPSFSLFRRCYWRCSNTRSSRCTTRRPCAWLPAAGHRCRSS